MSIRLQIRDAVIAYLNTARPPEIPEVTKRRWDPSETDRIPSMAVIFVREPVRRPPTRGFPVRKRELMIGVECVVAAEAPGLTDDLVEPMLIWATSVLGETKLGDLALEVDEDETIWETAQADLIYLRATVRFIISHQTAVNDLTRKQ